MVARNRFELGQVGLLLREPADRRELLALELKERARIP